MSKDLDKVTETLVTQPELRILEYILEFTDGKNWRIL